MKILLAVDGSDESYEAVRSLKYLSRSEEVLLVHVLDVPAPAYPVMMRELAQDIYRTLERTMRDDGTRLLERVRSLLPMGTGPITEHLLVGSPADQIVELAEKHQVGLTLLGTRGFGPIKERLLGSVAHRVLSFAPGAKFVLTRPLKTLRRILLPLLGAHDAEQAFEFLQRKPFRNLPEITLCSIVPTTRPPWTTDAVSAEQMEAHALRHARDFLEDISAKLAALGYTTHSTATVGTAVAGILTEAKAVDADLILLGSRGRHGVVRMVLGSVSHALLHQGAYPLMIFSGVEQRTHALK